MRYPFMLGMLFVIIQSAQLVPAQADTMSSSASGPASTPIHVNRCEPKLNTDVQNTNPYPVGYTRGYYPTRGPYYYRDVYGYNYTQARITQNAFLAIDYVNKSTKAMKTIDFGLVTNGRLVAEARDEGKFSPGVEIKHEFGINPNVFPLQTSYPQCVPLQVMWQDGTRWKNPHLPALHRSIYGQ